MGGPGEKTYEGVHGSKPFKDGRLEGRGTRLVAEVFSTEEDYLLEREKKNQRSKLPGETDQGGSRRSCNFGGEKPSGERGG